MQNDNSMLSRLSSITVLLDTCSGEDRKPSVLAKDPFESQVEVHSFRELISASKVVTVLKYTWIWDLCIIEHLKVS